MDGKEQNEYEKYKVMYFECDTSVIGGIHLLLFILSGCNFNCKNRFYPQGKISHTNTKYQFHGQICEILFA